MENHIPLFAFDFSMSKPAMSALVNNKLTFYVWPMNIDSISENALKKCGVEVFNRNLNPMARNIYNEHTLIVEHVKRASDLAELILNTIEEVLSNEGYDIATRPEIFIGNEGFAFSATGDAILDLSGYKYILMDKFVREGFRNFRTYSPITIKSTAGCAKKGMGKKDMINMIKKEDQDLHLFIHSLDGHEELLKKKTNYVMCVDDVVDSYWCLKTMVKKEGIKCILS